MMFDSVEGAVRCAVKVQQQGAYDGDRPPESRIQFCVGIRYKGKLRCFGG
jgi:hypothetical protein